MYVIIIIVVCRTVIFMTYSSCAPQYILICMECSFFNHSS